MYKKKGFSAKISSMKNQNFYTIKIASTKSAVWLENDFAIFFFATAVQSILSIISVILSRKMGNIPIDL